MGATLIDRPSTALTQADIATAGDLRYPRLAYMQGFLFGLTMSTAGASATLSVAAGNAVDSAGTAMMHLASAMAKTTAAWAAGTTNGGLDTGAIAASTWYHWFLIMNPTNGAVDVVFSATATPAAGPTTLPSGFTLFRRIGAMLTDASSHWVLFHQNGDEFLWDVRVIDVNGVTISATTATLVPLTVPPSLQVNATFIARLNFVTNGTAFIISSPDESDQAASSTTNSLSCSASSTSGVGHFNIRTSTSAQIRVRGNATACNYSIGTFGWIDTRGKLS